jgi:hypothetical protein
VAPRIAQAKVVHKKMKVIAAMRLIMDVLPVTDGAVDWGKLNGSNMVID